MSSRQTEKGIITNHWVGNGADPISRPSWIAAAKTSGDIKKLGIPDGTSITIHENMSKNRITLNKWVDRIWSKVISPLITGFMLINTWNAMNNPYVTGSMGGYEIHHAPDVNSAVALGIIGLLAGASIVASHKQEKSWEELENWASNNNLDRVSVAHPAYYRDMHF